MRVVFDARRRPVHGLCGAQFSRRDCPGICVATRTLQTAGVQFPFNPGRRVRLQALAVAAVLGRYAQTDAAAVSQAYCLTTDPSAASIRRKMLYLSQLPTRN